MRSATLTHLSRAGFTLLWTSAILNFASWWLAGLLLAGPAIAGPPPKDGREYVRYRGEYRPLHTPPYYRHHQHGLLLALHGGATFIALALRYRDIAPSPSRRERRRAQRQARLALRAASTKAARRRPQR